MISVIEAFESAVNNEFADWVKISVLSGLVYLSYFFYSTSQIDLFYYVGGVTAYLLLVLLLCVINNVRNGQNYVLPKFASSQFFVMALKAIVSIVPFVAFFVWLGFKILSLDVLSAYPEIEPICAWIVWIIITSICTLGVMVFGKTGNPLSLLDFKTISKYCIDVLSHLLFMAIVVAIVNAVILGIVAYLFAIFLSLQNPIFIAICSFAFVINVVVIGNCFAQIEYEVVPREEKEHII